MFGPEGFGAIVGDSGRIEAARGATVAVISRWSIRRSGAQPDGKPRLRFRASFSFVQPALMHMIQTGQLQGRVRVQMRTERHGAEDIDVVNWDEWKFEDGMLTLENVLHFDTKPIK